MPTVSLTMIVRDEEANLPACLASCADLFDELVIVDTGSTDRTKEIAAAARDKHGQPARVFDFTWCDDFAAARNESLRHATGDWVFWLDADDRIEPKWRGSVARVLQSLDLQDKVYSFNSVCPAIGDKPESVAPQYRLFPKLPGAKWSRRIHEGIGIPDREMTAVLTHVPIVHLGYLDPQKNWAKSQRNLRLLRISCDERPDDYELFFYLGVECFRHRRFAEAEANLKKSRAMCNAVGRRAPYDAKLDEMLAFMQAGEPVEIGGSIIA